MVGDDDEHRPRRTLSVQARFACEELVHPSIVVGVQLVALRHARAALGTDEKGDVGPGADEMMGGHAPITPADNALAATSRPRIQKTARCTLFVPWLLERWRRNSRNRVSQDPEPVRSRARRRLPEEASHRNLG